MAHPRLGAGALPAVVSLQSPPPTEGGRCSQDGRLTTVHPPGGAARHCAVGQTTDARGPEPPARDPGTAPRREMKHPAPTGRNLHASSPSPQSAPPPQGSRVLTPCSGARAWSRLWTGQKVSGPASGGCARCSNTYLVRGNLRSRLEEIK